MECTAVREAISAELDGEEAQLAAGVVAAHLAGCPQCRAWREAAHELTRRARLGSVLPSRDLTAAVLAAVVRDRAWPASAVRMVLLFAAAAQLLLGVMLLVAGEHDAGRHAAHELASFDFGLAAAFAVGVLRPRLSAGLVWPAGIAASGLAATAVADVLRGQAIGVDETQHLITVVGALALAWQAYPGRWPGRWTGRQLMRDHRGRSPDRRDTDAMRGDAGRPHPGRAGSWHRGAAA